MKRTLRLMTVAAAIALVAAACASSPDDTTSTTAASGDTTATTMASSDTTATTMAGDDTTATTTDTAVESIGEVKIGVENAYTPFNFIEDGTAQGFDYDIWAEICTRIGCDPVFVEAGWPAVIEETGQGVYDTAADGISITEDRKEVVDFSDPYMTTIQKLMVRADEDRFTNLEEFQAGDYKLGTQVGTTNYELGAKLVGEDRIDAFDQFGVAVQALIAGDVDAVIIDDIAGQGYQGANADQTTLLPDDLQSDPLGFIFPKGSELTAKVNEAIADMKDDGTLETLIKKWFIEFEG